MNFAKEWCYSLYFNYFCPLMYNAFCKKERPEKEPVGRCYHIYDITKDIIMLEYSLKGIKYTLCIPRKSSVSVPKIYRKIVADHDKSGLFESHIVMDAILDNDIDITDRINQYVGPNGEHLKYGPIQLHWFLSNDELRSFKRLEIITNDFKRVIITKPEKRLLKL